MPRDRPGDANLASIMRILSNTPIRWQHLCWIHTDAASKGNSAIAALNEWNCASLKMLYCH